MGLKGLHNLKLPHQHPNENLGVGAKHLLKIGQAIDKFARKFKNLYILSRVSSNEARASSISKKNENKLPSTEA